MLPSLYTGTPAFWPLCPELSLNPGDDGADDKRDKKVDAVPATPKSVHPVGILMNCSHASAVGSSLGFCCTAIRTIIS